MNFNKTLDPADYAFLQPEMIWFSNVMARLTSKGLSTALNHTHRRWEYGFAKRLVDQQAKLHNRALKIIDVGSGSSTLGIGLRLTGHEVWETDSAAYGDPVGELIRQCQAFNVEIPYVRQPAEAMPEIKSDFYDVTLCISVMEHVDKKLEKQAWLELKRITQPGGVIFCTMDFNPDPNIDTPFRSIQQTIYHEAHLREVLGWLECEPISEPDWSYHGDQVNNYSFCSLGVRKP